MQMICTLELDPFRGQCSPPPGWDSFLNDMEYPQQGSNFEVHIQLFGIFRWHGWSEDLYLTLRTPALGTEPQMFTHMHAHLGVRVKWMDGAHTSPNSLFRAVNSQLPISNSRIPIISPQLNSRVSIKSFNRGLRIKG